MAEATASRSPAVIGPPLAILLLGFASVAVSALLLAVDTTRAHILGYVIGSVVPLLLIGFFRRADLDRRRSAGYVASRLVGPIILVIAIATLVLAGLHVWPIATDLAS